eukprot:2446799-Ditylum_brightwellii.AAC.1
MGQTQDVKKKKASMPKTLNMTSTNNNPFEGQEVCFECCLQQMYKRFKNVVQPKAIDVLFNTPDGNTEGNPLGSDYKMDGDEFGGEMLDEKN